METKKSKVTGIIFGKSGQGKNGAWHSFTVGFLNGDSGTYFASTNPQTYFVLNQEAEYTKEVTQNGQYTNTKISPMRSQGNKGNWNGGSPTAQNKRTALECAVSLAVAGKIDSKEIGLMANKYLAWLDGETKPVAKQEPAQATAPFLPPPDASDDLPF